MSSQLYNYSREKFIVPFRLWVYRFFRRTLIIFVLALVANFFFSYFFYTPKMWRLRELNNHIVMDYTLLAAKIKGAQEDLAQVHSRDINQYRSVFSVDTLSNPLIGADYPDEYYQAMGYGRYADLMRGTELSLDRLSRGLYWQSISLDQIEGLALTKDIMMEHLPTIWPMDRRMLRGHIGAFGVRIHPITRRIQMHDGADFAGPVGTKVYATGNGVIVANGGGRGYGLQVLLDHKFGYKTRYAHLSKIMVQPGQWVKRGDVIGLLGNTGASTGPHLHYEVIHRGKTVNPLSYLSRDMSSEEFRDIIENARATTYEKDE